MMKSMAFRRRYLTDYLFWSETDDTKKNIKLIFYSDEIKATSTS